MPPPDRAKFEVVLGLLGEVKKWKEPKKVGKREYNDEKFFTSCREQFEKEARPMSARQLEFLVRMAVLYEDQIKDCAERLREAGLATSASVETVKKADPALVDYCFGVMDRIVGLNKNPFMKSLREQVDRGHGLSMKQFGILAREIGENASGLEDCEAVRAKLAEFVPGGYEVDPGDPNAPKLLDLLKSITEWRPKARRGKRVYDDKEFVKSLGEQYTRKHSLSERQVQALRRVAAIYRDQIPTYMERAEELGLKTDNGKSAKDE